MKITVNKQELSEAINNASRAVAVKSAIAALEGIRITVEENKLVITGYDLEIGIKTQVNAVTEGRGEFVINSRLLGEMIRKMPEEEVTIEVSENLSTRVYCGDTEYNVIALSSEEYPDIPEFEKDEYIKLSQPQLKDMINRTIFAVSVSDNKPVLMGELFEIEDGIFNLVAIDGYRLAVRKAQTKNNENYKFVVPAKALKEVASLLSDDEDKECIIYTSKKHINFDINGYKVISRLLEGEFHNYRGSITSTSTTEVIISTRSLISSLERCALLINDKIKAPVRCTFENGNVKIFCSTSIGKVNDHFKADISGDYVEIGFNCRYLLETIKACEGDKVKMLISGGLSPMKVVPVNGDNFIYLVLPVRLKAE